MKKYVVLLLTCLTLHSCELVNPTPAPKADFTKSYGTGGEVKFNLLVRDSEGFEWDFGDGDTSTKRVPIHIYKRNGRYIAKVNVTGKTGKTLVSKALTISSI